MQFTFEYQRPLSQDWELSDQRFDTLFDAVLSMADWLRAFYENGCQMAGRITTVEN